MTFKKLTIVSALSIAMSITSAQAAITVLGGGFTEAVLLSGSLLALSHTAEHHKHKIAVLNAGPAAVEVLNGAPANDLFRSGREAIEAMAEGMFANDQDAAVAILELGEQIRKDEGR